MSQKKSTSWIARQKRDPYVIKAKQTGYRSRASYKLLELNQAYKLFRAGMCVVDLGSAPGGWSQVMANLLGKNPKIYALDILDMDPIQGVNFIKGDFNDPTNQVKLKEMLGNNAVNWVISDMAPNLSGVIDIDQPRIMELAESAWQFTTQVLAKDGGFLIKLFQGDEVKPFLSELNQHFRRVSVKKPDASRSQSREIYILAQGFKAIGRCEP